MDICKGSMYEAHVFMSSLQRLEVSASMTLCSPTEQAARSQGSPHLGGSIFDSEGRGCEAEQDLLGPGGSWLQQRPHMTQALIRREGGQLLLHGHSGDVL